MPNLQENMKESLKKSGHSIIIVFFLLIWKIFHASQGIKVMFSVKRSVQPWQIVTSSISFSRISTSNHLGLHCNNVGSISQSTDWSSKVSIWKSESMCSARFLFCWSLECSSQSASLGEGVEVDFLEQLIIKEGVLPVCLQASSRWLKIILMRERKMAESGSP